MTSNVDIADPTAEAERLGETCELMATYAELGAALDSGRVDGLAEECLDLVGRLIALGKAEVRESDQRWAMWMSRNTTFGGEG